MQLQIEGDLEGFRQAATGSQGILLSPTYGRRLKEFLICYHWENALCPNHLNQEFKSPGLISDRELLPSE